MKTKHDRSLDSGPARIVHYEYIETTRWIEDEAFRWK